jgi:uncharacterized protein DUF6457
MTLSEWSSELSAALGIDLDYEIDEILDMAREAAHRVDRPAAPLTAFLVGYAAASRGGSPDDVSDCIDIATELAAEHGDET